jgi:hypothetical protein
MAADRRRHLSLSERCQRSNVSRTTGYHWGDRDRRLGPAGLEDRARTPRHAVTATAPAVSAARRETRQRHPAWGGKPRLACLPRRHPRRSLPQRATGGALLTRHGLGPTPRAPRPPAASRAAQPRRVETCRAACTPDRPPEARARPTPASCSRPSRRPLPARIPPLAEPDRCEVRSVSATGGSHWHTAGDHVSTVCAGPYVGREDLDDGVWHLSGRTLTIGRFDDRTMHMEEACGRRNRQHVSPMSPDVSVTSVPGRSGFPSCLLCFSPLFCYASVTCLNS